MLTKNGLNYRVLATTTLGLLIGASGTTIANAQSVSDVPTASLEEVVVTAERREADQQKTAIAITTISGKDMAEKSLQTLKQVLETVPNLQVANAAQGGIVFLRGIGSNSDSNYVDPDIAISVDGVYGGRSEGVLNAAFDLQRIEVLRGPQGTLYGRNAIGGSVNVLSADPTHEFEVIGNAQLGNYSLAHLDAAVNIPLGDTFALRFAGLRETRDGYASNGGWASNLTGARVKGLWEPNDKLRVVATAELNFQRGLGATTYPNDSNPFFAGAGACTFSIITRLQPCSTATQTIFAANGTTTTLPNGQPALFSWPTDPNNPWYVDPYHVPDRQNMRFRNFSMNVDYDLGFAKLTVIPAYAWSGRVAVSSLVTGEIQGQTVNSLTGGAPTIVIPYYPYAQNPAGSQEFTEKQKTMELRLASSSEGKLKWVVGGLYLDSTNQPSTTSLAATYPGAATGYITNPGGDRTTKSKSIFGQLTYSLTDAFRATAGLRYNKDERTFPYGLKTTRLPIINTTTGAITSNTPFVTCTVGANVNTGGLATCVPTAVPLVDTGVSYKNTSYAATTWKAGIEYDLRPQSMLYADVSTGYKAGGFSINGAQNPYKPEFLTSYDLGIKNRFLDNTLQVNINAYYYLFRDYQVSSANFVLTNLVCDPSFTNGVDYTALGLCQTAATTTTATAIPGLAGNAQVTINGGQGKTYGLEIENQWLFSPTNKVDLNVSYLHARYGLINTGANYFLDSDSYQVVSDSPEWSGTLGLEHYFNFKDGGSITVRGETKLSTFYYDSVNRLDANSLTQVVANGIRYPLLNNGTSADSAYQPGYSRSNAYVTYHAADKHWTVVGWVKNIENKAQKVNDFSRNRVWLSDPQTYGVNISTHF